jgi:GDP-4-dehydro-6-deoxy-D-mannose reductase
VYTRTFNLTGPGEPPGLVGGDLARRIVQVERSGPEGYIQVGDLTSERDFVDVRDAVQAYWLVCSQGMPGEVYNVCSGRSVRIEQVLRLLVGYSTSRIQVQMDRGLTSSQDVPISVGNPEKLYKATGWHPTIPLEESLRTLLDDCRKAD